MLWQISRKTSRMGKLLLSMVFQGTQYHQSKKKKKKLSQSNGSYSRCKGGTSCTGLEILHNFSVFSEKRRKGIQNLVQEFQNLLSLDKIDTLQSSILDFLRKEKKYLLMDQFIRHLVPSCCYWFLNSSFANCCALFNDGEAAWRGLSWKRGHL